MAQLLRAPLCALALSALVAGCGGGGAGGASGKSADWAQDTCKTFPVDTAAKAAGIAAVKTEPAGQVANEVAVVSSCTYSTADGATIFTVLLRQTLGDNLSVDEELAGIQSQPEMTGTFDPVAMPKGKALWSAKMRTLSYVPEAGRMIVVTPPDAIVFGKPSPPIDELKAKAIAIATAAEG